MKVAQFSFRAAAHPQDSINISQNNFRISYKHLHNIQKMTLKKVKKWRKPWYITNMWHTLNVLHRKVLKRRNDRKFETFTQSNVWLFISEITIWNTTVLHYTACNIRVIGYMIKICSKEQKITIIIILIKSW